MKGGVSDSSALGRAVFSGFFAVLNLAEYVQEDKAVDGWLLLLFAALTGYHVARAWRQS